MAKPKRIPHKTSYGAVITLSAPSKMPGYSWGLPAGATCPAAKGTIREHGDLAVCSACYAKGGNYRFPTVKDSQAARFQFVRHSLKHNGGNEFVAALVSMISRAVDATKDPVFRIHDSGDFYCPEYVGAWRRIAEALPQVHFWASTREYLRDAMLPSLRRFAALPNVTVRPSAARIGDPAPIVDGLQAGTAVGVGKIEAHATCPATHGDKPSCDANNCRACWYAKDTPVNYMLHGALAKRALRSLPMATVA